MRFTITWLLVGACVLIAGCGKGPENRQGLSPPHFGDERWVEAARNHEEPPTDFINTPVSQYFGEEQSRGLRAQISAAMEAFRAEHQRDPKGWPEFEQEILIAGKITLPPLRGPWDSYKYGFVRDADGAQQGGLTIEVPRESK